MRKSKRARQVRQESDPRRNDSSNLPDPIVFPVVTTEYSIWYWHKPDGMVRRTDRATGEMGVDVILSTEDNNMTGATKRAARREYDRILTEQHEAAERLES